MCTRIFDKPCASFVDHFAGSLAKDSIYLNGGGDVIDGVDMLGRRADLADHTRRNFVMAAQGPQQTGTGPRDDAFWLVQNITNKTEVSNAGII